jgi:uncharacterized protein (TIGR02646 family)
MINIVKGAGPDSLREYAAKGYHYDEHVSFTPIKQEIRDSLCVEQGYLCCFCMNRIEPDMNSMQIAHIKNQADYLDIDCNYNNHMGSCSSRKSCNATQRNRDLKFDLIDSTHPIKYHIAFDCNGTISSSDAEFEIQINDWLMLNSKQMFLKQNRSEIYKSVIHELDKVSNFGEKKKKAARLLEHWKSRDAGKLRPFCGVAVWILEKKISQWITK